MNNTEYCVEDVVKYVTVKRNSKLHTLTKYLLLRSKKEVCQKAILVFSCVFMFETVTVLKLKVTCI